MCDLQDLPLRIDVHGDFTRSTSYWPDDTKVAFFLWQVHLPINIRLTPSSIAYKQSFYNPTLNGSINC